MEPRQTEDQFTKTIESYTAALPSSGYLAVAIGAMGLSLACQVAGRGKWRNFIARWVPTWLLFGLYNKLVKLYGHDRYDRGCDDESQLTPADEVNAKVDLATCQATGRGSAVNDYLIVLSR
jgi:hypothetical protein